ncbi:hypothetical protein EVAR_37674_1 [Eumeta japonica]|uniref:Uncharacterized protein n=1 Tax=Eumeta variegata TaxID=151549 RepID=A0A4C1YZ90_EUMVA|nr:hypothetical protein EVAR_37674_1 [Eumeta japonica]
MEECESGLEAPVNIGVKRDIIVRGNPSPRQASPRQQSGLPCAYRCFASKRCNEVTKLTKGLFVFVLAYTFHFCLEQDDVDGFLNKVGPPV